MTTKITKHLASVCSLFTHCSVDTTKNRLHCYRGKDCIKNLYKAEKLWKTCIKNQDSIQQK